jgi:nucleoside-diphosphate-sugar epimerase
MARSAPSWPRRWCSATATRPSSPATSRPGPCAGLRHEALDCTDAGALAAVVERHGITQIYHLAAALSASGEQHPMWAWDLNMTGLLNVLELARSHKLQRVFWPSSIAAFGPGTRGARRSTR